MDWLRAHAPNRILCQRIFKCTVNSSVAFILCLVPSVRGVIGDEPAMLPLLSVMVHPGRRLGTMLEGVLFCTSGLLIGNAYALLARFIAQCILGDLKHLPDSIQLTENYERYRAALAVLAIFQVMMLFYHGWMRVISHKFFGIVFPLFLVVHFAFSTELYDGAAPVVKSFTVPFFLGIGLSLACNLLLFPEFGSSYLGTSIVDTLNELHVTLDSAIQFFNKDGENYASEPPTLAHLIKKKHALRGKLNSTLAVLQECSYEISYSYSSPQQLKPLIASLKTQMSYTNALINASQLAHTSLMNGDIDEKFKNALSRSMGSLFDLHKNISQSIYILKISIARSYDADKSLVQSSVCFNLDDIDEESVNFDTMIDKMVRCLAILDIKFREEFKELSTVFEDYLKPNDQMFIMSSFLMNLKETTNAVCNMLKEAQFILETRMRRQKKGFFGRKLWISFLRSRTEIQGWMDANRADVMTAGESASLNGDSMSRAYVEPHSRQTPAIAPEVDSTLGDAKTAKKPSPVISFLNSYARHKPHIRFGVQCAVGITLATFPMFVPEARHWFADIKGPWIGFVCILVLEPEVGSTFFVFFLRGVGVISGAAWGYLSYVAGNHQKNPYLETVVTALGAAPGFYFFLGTPYIKAAIIGIISIYIVLLASAVPSDVGSSILQNFAKRCLAMIYGGAVALICQVVIFPNKARDELIQEVVHSASNISKMLLLYATGLEGETIQLSMPERRFDKFQYFSLETKSCLIRADAYRTSAKKEPRLKGSYRDIERIFFEITFIMKEIVDRLDNIVQLRRAYGSAIIEEFNKEVHPYRRQLQASMNNSMKAVEFALSTKSPLPQYLPSPTIAHKRLLEKVTELVQIKYKSRMDGSSSQSDSDGEIFVNFRGTRASAALEVQQEGILKEKFLSWNATSAATEEVIRYIEELLELTKVLVGVNEFKYGFLSRSLYSEYAARAARGFEKAMHTGDTAVDIDQRLSDSDEDGEGQEMDEAEIRPMPLADDESIESRRSGISKGFRRRVYSIGSWVRGYENHSTASLGQYDGASLSSSEQLPLSLMRVVSKKAEGS